MNSAFSSLRILPAAAEAVLRPSSNGASASGAAPGDGSPEFLEVLHSALDDMQHLQGTAETKIAGVLNGSGTDVHSALIAVEQADLSFQLMMQVRNKIVSAYQEISRMQF
jgi:flagellar hook-basal body complex protein FliE